MNMLIKLGVCVFVCLLTESDYKIGKNVDMHHTIRMTFKKEFKKYMHKIIVTGPLNALSGDLEVHNYVGVYLKLNHHSIAIFL